MKLAYQKPALVKREALSQITANGHCVSGLVCKAATPV